jgi:hypothetical protein
MLRAFVCATACVFTSMHSGFAKHRFESSTIVCLTTGALFAQSTAIFDGSTQFKFLAI